MKTIVTRLFSLLDSLRDLPPLFFRLVLAYGFYGPALKKWADIQAISAWFASMEFPLPTLNAYMAATTELVGAAFLFAGFATRLISIPLMVVMVVAIKAVHWKHGFACGENGFEVPFYYFLMLFSLVVTGAGRFSVDGILKRRG